MKTGMPILYCFDSLEDNFRFAKEHNFDFVELNLNFSYCRKQLLDENYMKRLFEKYPLEITMHYFDEADFGTYEEVAESYYIILERYLVPAAKFGLKNLIVHLIEGPVVTISGVKNYVYEKEFDEYTARLVSRFKQVDKLCKDNGVNLAIENSKTVPYMTRTYDVLQKEGFTFTLDIGHNEVCDDIPRQVFEKYKYKGIKEFHIHDVIVSNGVKKDHVSLGTGVVDVAYYKRKAEEIGAYCLLELKSREDLITSIDYFKKLK